MDRPPTALATAVDLFFTFLVKLVLEVFGGGGAVWGFSEACGLRTPDNLDVWRPTALTVAFIFFIRWIRQLQEALLEKDSKWKITEESKEYKDVPTKEEVEEETTPLNSIQLSRKV